jgi:Tfp pilus assembly protein PilF
MSKRFFTNERIQWKLSLKSDEDSIVIIAKGRADSLQFSRMKRFFWLAVFALLLTTGQTQAQGLDDQYIGIYNLIQQGDLLENGGRLAEARTKYVEAQTSLQKFQKINPDWNPKVVSFRLDYLAGKTASLAAHLPAPAPGAAQKPASPPGTPVKTAVEIDFQAQLDALKDQVRQIQADKMVLEAKLKESLSVQPSAVDPRQLTKAEERIKSLQKEADLLKFTLGQEKARRAQVADARGVAQTQQALEEANRRLAEQTEKANTLALEKTALQNKLNTLAPSSWNAAALETTKRALEDANRQLGEQKQLATRLASEKEALEARLKSAPNPAADATALRAENQILKKQLADLRAAAPGSAKAAENAQKLAQAQIAALQSDKEILRLEKMALENRVKQLSNPAVASTVLPAAQAGDAARIKQLERERDELEKKLQAANKELFGRNGQAVAARVQEMENQLAILRARLEVFESRQVPYTPEELALFKTPPATLVVADPKNGRKSVKELPTGTATLVAEAERYFSVKQLDKAEEKYQQVLRQDQKNVATLANLAVIQLERNELVEAEKNITQAVALAPNDAYSLSILGFLRFRQEKYDDALDALSRAAKLDPENAQVQNYLGITLSQKGMRIPAETALRKAIQLQPGYASAHHNLAVIYVTQQPPLVELGRWHYQKALAAGHQKNPELEALFDSQKTASTGK